MLIIDWQTHVDDDREKKRCAELVCFSLYPHSPCLAYMSVFTIIQVLRPVSMFPPSLSITVPCVYAFVLTMNPKNLRETVGKAKFSAEL